MKKNIVFLSIVFATVLGLFSVSCSKSDDDKGGVPDIYGFWNGESSLKVLANNTIVCTIDPDGTFSVSINGGATRIGKYEIVSTSQSADRSYNIELLVTWSDSTKSEVSLNVISSAYMYLVFKNTAHGDYKMWRSSGGGEGGSGGGSSETTSLVGKTFFKSESSVNNSGGIVVDNVEISFTSNSACTLHCYGYEDFYYSDGSKDRDSYDTGTMTGSYTISGNKVHISCYSTKYSQQYVRDEVISNGSLVGFTQQS